MPSRRSLTKQLIIFSTSFALPCRTFSQHQEQVQSQDSISRVVCVAGQCLYGLSNTTIGATISAPNGPASLLLLPDSYLSTSNPQLLHQLLTSSQASLTPSPGFENVSKSLSLPLDLRLSPGISLYSDALYTGSASFTALPSSPAPINSSGTPLTARSLALSLDTWAAVKSSSSSTNFIIWSSIPDISQLPSPLSSSQLSLSDIQSSLCSPPCSSGGACNPQSSTCTCLPNFTGPSCESCFPGHFSPSCTPCPAGCPAGQCDDGIGGTGQCKVTILPNNAPGKCNCQNGQCDADGSCSCLPGFAQNASNGTQCASCLQGFFFDADGQCKSCSQGCSSCTDTTGDCLACATGFTKSQNDETKCIPVQSTKPGGVPCPTGSFSDGKSDTCTACDKSCQSCSGPTSGDCQTCLTGFFLSNGNCISADSNGNCEGSKGALIADNNKKVCDTCGPKCTTCQIPSFSPVTSTVDQVKCTGCLPGFVLSNGQCLSSCPSETFLDPRDNVTCTTCDSTCSSCSGSSTFCILCTGGRLASPDGKCIATCPSNTFSSSGRCVPCHPDCTTCSGGSGFNQCLTCSSSNGRPVLSNGQCLPMCLPAQFFDLTNSSCKDCDSSCSSCVGSGNDQCLSCVDGDKVLRGGKCVDANCTNGTSVVKSLGACLSELVHVPGTTSPGGAPGSPSIPGLSDPTKVVTSTRPLEWWEILLMALGCAFIFLLFLVCWRRRMRKKREQLTERFAMERGISQKASWKTKFYAFGDRIFGYRNKNFRKAAAGVAGAGADSSSRVAVDVEVGVRGIGAADATRMEELKLMKMRNEEEARHHREMEKLQLYGAYDSVKSGLTRRSSY